MKATVRVGCRETSVAFAGVACSGSLAMLHHCKAMLELQISDEHSIIVTLWRVPLTSVLNFGRNMVLRIADFQNSSEPRCSYC